MRYKNSFDEYNNMSTPEKLYFYKRCREDCLFFIENCVLAPLAGGYQHVNLYEPQKEIVRKFIVDHFIIMNKSRQTGGSFVTQAICAWLVLFQDNYVIGVISRSAPESSSFNKKVLDILDNIPQLFIRPDAKTDYAHRNENSFSLKLNNSRLISQAVSPQKPEGVLRGNSIVTLIIDEAAFIEHIDIAFTAIMPATSQAQNVAKKLGIPYGNFVISTPNGMKGRGEWYYKQWMKAIVKKTLYHACKIHWRDIPGLDDEWYKIQCDALDNDKKRIAQEMEMAFISSDGAFWSDDVQLYLNNVLNSPDDENIKIIKYTDIGELKLFNFHFNRNDFYLIGVDIASENGNDNSTIQIVNHRTMEHVGEFMGKLEIMKFVEIIKEIALLFPHNLLIIESSGGFGSAILNILSNDDRNFNIYGETRHTGTGKKRRIKFIPGLATSNRTRPLIIEAMYDYVVNNLELIKSKDLASELLSLTRKNDKVQASTNCTDDLVMALGFCLYTRKYQTEFYSHMIVNVNSTNTNSVNVLSTLTDIDSMVADISYDVGNLDKVYERYGMNLSEYNKLKKHLNPLQSTDFNNSYLENTFDSILDAEYDELDEGGVFDDVDDFIFELNDS